MHIHVIARCIACPCAVRMIIPREHGLHMYTCQHDASCGHASCSRPSDTRLPHAYLHHPSSLPSSSIQSLSCKMRCYGMSFCVPAVHTRKTPLRPTAPPQHSLPRSREASASARRAATHHTPDRQTQGFLTHTSILLSPQARASRVCHAKCGAMACRFVCLLFIHVNDSQTHCSALLTQESRGFCVSTSCGYASCSRPSDARLPQTNLHHPSFS